jgi:hypothetical protein
VNADHIHVAPGRRKSRRDGETNSAPKHAVTDSSKIAKLIRLLASDQPGEVVAAVTALRRTLDAAGLDFHALAAAAEAGLRRPAERPQASWEPPAPDLGNWQSMAWWLHWHRHKLSDTKRARVADYLLGTAFAETDGVVKTWHLNELRSMVATVQAAR